MLFRYAGQLLKLRDLLAASRMAVYIDERTLSDLAKIVEDDNDIENSDEDGDEDDEYEELRMN